MTQRQLTNMDKLDGLRFGHAQGTAQPFIIGNINAANLLSSSLGGLGNNVFIPANAMGLPSCAVNNNQVIGILPVLIQGSMNSDALQGTTTINASQLSQINNDGKGGQPVTNTSSQSVVNFVDGGQQTKLTSSDTLNLSTSASTNLISADTLPLLFSSPSLLNLQSLARQKSSASQSSFSLVSDMSNNSISLESIPTVSLFKPDQTKEGERGNELPENVPMETENSTRTSDNTVQSQTHFTKKKLTVSASRRNTRSKSKRNKNLVSQNFQTDENLDDTTDKEDDEVHNLEAEKRRSLTRDDTLQLPTASQSNADTVVLPNSSALPAAMAKSSASLLETCSSIPLSIASGINGQAPIPSLPSIPSLMLTNSFLGGALNPDLLLNLITEQPSENQPPPTRNLSLDQLNINASMIASLQRSLQGSFSTQPLANIPSSSKLAVKSTQTDWVLGNSVVYFKAMPEEPKETIEGNIPTSLLLEDEFINAPQFVAEGQSLTSSILNLDQQNQPTLSIQPANQESTVNEEADDYEPFYCSTCEKGFCSKREFDAHEKSHKKIMKCNLCTATFTRMGNYTRHRKIHDLKPESRNVSTCTECGREFLQRCDLKRHMLIHNKQEPYRCEKCGKGYIRHSDLVVHMRFHNKEKLFKCNMCEKSFFQSGDLNRHVRRAHKPNSQLTCGHCNRKYACDATLIRHMKIVHKDIIVNSLTQKDD